MCNFNDKQMSNNFITNDKAEDTLQDRLGRLISGSQELKFLVGFFYFSGWSELYKHLKANADVHLKILVGLNVDPYLGSMIETRENDAHKSRDDHFDDTMRSIEVGLNNPEMDNKEFHEQLPFFTQLLKENRIEIKKTLEPNHAKLYLFKLKDHQVTDNILITGSSNLTKAGLIKQNEFNVEIKDYGFDTAEAYFDELWTSAIPISDAKEGIQKITDFLENKSQATLVTPFEAYVLILKTYVDLYEAKQIEPATTRLLKRNGFKNYKYQLDAVQQARHIIDTYNGVIIADVVGLGKSVIASLIAYLLGKRGLIICPPGLIGDRNENTGWHFYKKCFELDNWDIESIGKIDQIEESIKDSRYEVIIVDEAHRFRNQDTAGYVSLMNICRGRQVILLTATPFNNKPSDIFSLLKLFLIPGKSNLTLDSDIEERFYYYDKRFKDLLSIKKDYASPEEKKRTRARNQYRKIFDSTSIDSTCIQDEIKKISNEIKGIIAPVVIRRNRLDLQKDAEYKKEIGALSVVKDPEEQFYKLTEEQSKFYDQIIEEYFVQDGKFKGAIYQPALYQKLNDKENRDSTYQSNLYDLMRRLLVKRFESSFGAFKKSIDRFLETHEMILGFIEKTNKYIVDQKFIRNNHETDENIEQDAYEVIKKSLEDPIEKNQEKDKHIRVYHVNSFERKDGFINDIKNDIDLFKDITAEIDRLDLLEKDPKRAAVVETIKKVLDTSSQPMRKVILFTEYRDTVKHLEDYIKAQVSRTLCYDGKSKVTASLVRRLNKNFNAKIDQCANEFDVLVTTDKLSEGLDLNRAGLIINYDIPWNPTRVIQRVGRINRMSKRVFDELLVYNFFPTRKGASLIKSKEIAGQKMFLIHNALGEDSKILNEEEQPNPSLLFKKIMAHPEQDEQLSMSTVIRNKYNEIKNAHRKIIEKVQDLPHRIKTAKRYTEHNVVVLQKKGLVLFSTFCGFGQREDKPKEITFDELIKYVECRDDEERLDLSSSFWDSYERIKSYKPKYRNQKSEHAAAAKALNSLKSIKKTKDPNLNLDPKIKLFVDVLIKDIKEYKTLPEYTLKELDLGEKKEVVENIKALNEKLGANYLKVISARSEEIKNNIIVAVGNYKSETD